MLGDGKSGPGFLLLKNNFPRFCEAKLKEVIFVAPQIRELMKGHDFEESLNAVEKAAWKSFKKIITEFLGSRKARNYGELVSELLQNYKAS